MSGSAGQTSALAASTHASAQVVVFGIPNCDTIKKARGWLMLNGVPHYFHDFKKQGLPLANVRRWIETTGYDKLLNRRGPTWRNLGPSVQASVVDAASAIAVMQAHSSVVKRPVVQWPGGQVTVGFDAEIWKGLI